MAEEKEAGKKEEKEEVGELKEEKKEEPKTCKTSEEPEEKEGFSKEKLYGIAMAVAGIVIFGALVMFYPGFVDLLIKGIVLVIALAAIGLILLGIVFALYA